MRFELQTIEEQGFATWTTYAYSDMTIQVVRARAIITLRVFLRVNSQVYELADLMKNDSIRECIQTHELAINEDDMLAAEAEWYVMLLRVALSQMRGS
jgi:hypothetical protein